MISALCSIVRLKMCNDRVRIFISRGGLVIGQVNPKSAMLEKIFDLRGDF